MARHNRTTIECEIDDESYTLEPTLSAMSKIERQFGSVTQAMETLRNPSLDQVSFVVAAGAGLTSNKQREKLKEAIFNQGLMNVNPRAVEYLIALLNPSGEEPQEGEGDQDDQGK